MAAFRRISATGISLLALGAAACSPAGETSPPDSGNASQATAAASTPEAPEDVANTTPETTVPAAAQPVAPAQQVQDVQGVKMQDSEQSEQSGQANVLDPRLFGVWVNEKQINSPGGAGGFASFSTVMTMILNADGTVQQFTQSVGGGGDWSSNSGRKLDFEGRWRASNGTFLVHGMGLPDFTPAATYTFSGEYLVTQNDMGRLIWQKR